MTIYRNEISSSQRNLWQNNFGSESDNIFNVFQNNPIVLSKTIYEQLCIKYNAHIRIYFGLDNLSNPKVIAVPTFKLDEMDSKDVERTWDDITTPEAVYELYSQKTTTLNEAKAYIQNWTNLNGNHELFLRAFIIPRTNLFQIFENQNKEYTLLDFGLKKEIKLIAQSCNANGAPDTTPIFLDYTRPCPPYCSKVSDLYL